MTEEGRWLSYRADDVARLRRIPPTRRCRGFFLYASGGARFQDWWLLNAASVLGHDIPGAQQAIKNAVSRGAPAGYPVSGGAATAHVADRFLEVHGPRERPKDLPTVIAMGNPAAWALGAPGPPLGVRAVAYDPADRNEDPTAPPEAASAPAVLPFGTATTGVGADAPADAPAGARNARAAGDYSAYVVRPYIGPTVLAPVGSKAAGVSRPFGVFVVPVGDLGLGVTCFRVDDPVGPSPAQLAAARRQLAFLANTTERPIAFDPELRAPDLWERRGAYLLARCSRQAYNTVFDAYLAAGIVLSPRYPGPSVVPAVLSDGEVQKAVAVTDHVAASIVDGYAGDAYE